MADYVTTEPAFDFERGDFVIINGRPKMVVGMDRLRSWIGKVLRTQKERYKIYNGTSYGTRIKDTFVGKTFTHDYMLSEIQREITENLEKNKDIVSVDGFSATVDGTHLIVEFTVTTVYGTTDLKEAL